MKPTLSEQVDEFKRDKVMLALYQCDWHRARTARYLGVTREGLYKMMKRLDIEVVTFPPHPQGDGG